MATSIAPMTYCRKAAASEKPKLANIAKALYLYWLSADKFFG